MINEHIFNRAVAKLDSDEVAELQKIVRILEGFTLEMERLQDITAGFEQLSIRLQKENEKLEKAMRAQAFKIDELTKGSNLKESLGTKVIRPKEEFLIDHELNYDH